MVFILKKKESGKILITDILYLFILFFLIFLTFIPLQSSTLRGLNIPLTKIHNLQVLQSFTLLYILQFHFLC